PSRGSVNCGHAWPMSSPTQGSRISRPPGARRAARTPWRGSSGSPPRGARAPDAFTGPGFERENAVADAQAKRRVREDVAELAGRLRAAWGELTPAEEEFAELDALTDVVNGRGQNARKMSLRAYVLAARPEEGAVAATARLRPRRDA